MPHSRVNIFIDRLARGYHVTILELHSFGTLSPELTTNYNLDIVTKRTLLCKENRAKKKKKKLIYHSQWRTKASFTYLTSFCTTLHNESKNTIASPKNKEVEADSIYV